MSRRDAVALAALALVALALRCAFIIDHDEDIDALRFALGVDRFDVAELRPHAPYYPVVVVAAKALAALGATARGAMGILSAISGAAVVTLTALLARDAVGRRAAIIAGLLALSSPHLWLSSQKLLSDMTGTALFTLGLWLCVRARRLEAEGGEPSPWRTAAMLILGVALGARLSYFPIALACLLIVARTEGGARALLSRSRDLAAGVALWLMPLVILGGPRALVRTTWVQGVGHFTRWGGSVVTVPSPIDRARGVVWGIWANVLGGAWIDAPAWRWAAAPILVLLLAMAAREAADLRGWARRHPEIVLSAAAYFLWALLGQNTANKPRHWTPLAPLLIVALAAGADRLIAWSRAGHAAIALLFATWIVDGEELVRAHRAPSPAAAIVGFLRDGGARDRRVITCALDRMIHEGAPAQAIVRAASEAEVLGALEASPGSWITGECLTPPVRAALSARGIEAEAEARVVFSRPRSRYVDALWPNLGLWSVGPRVTPSR